MADARPPKLTGPKRTGSTLAGRKTAERKLSAASLRELARSHTVAAVQVLADVATTGSSEASRISAAIALLDRGYGKSGLAGKDGESPPTLYQRIELVDGTEDKSGDDNSTSSQPGADRQD